MSITRRAIMKAAVLSSIPAGAVTAFAHDPLLETINAYRAGKAAFMAIPVADITVGNEDGLVMATYGPVHEVLLRRAPKATSLAGVREAIRFAFEEYALVEPIAENALRSALVYLDGRA